MHSPLALPLAALAPALAAAATHTVMVAQGGLVFVPDTITAAHGDTVEFKWANGGHSVSQGDPNNACMPSGAGGFNSGEVREEGSVWRLVINSTDPIYYYCGVSDHCEAGMVGGINVQNLDSYKQAAESASQSVLPQVVQGGMFGGSSSGGDMMSSGMMSGSMTSSMMMSSSTDMGAMSSSMMMSSSMSGSDSMTTSATATGGAGSGSMSSSAANSADAQSSMTGSGNAAAPTEIVGALLAGLPAAIMALL